MLLVVDQTPAHATTTYRANTVEFFAGQHTGTTGANENVKNDLAAQTFQLAETGVTVTNAYIELYAETAANTVQTYASSYLYFGACTPACTPTTSQVTSTGNLGTSSANSRAQYIRLRASVTSALSSYTGSAATLNFAVGYCFSTAATCTGTTAANIFAATAKLVVTYQYDDSSTNRTNSVYYPLESAAGVGSKTALITATCTMGTDCAQFSYNAAIPEISTQYSQFFDTRMFLDQSGGTDIDVYPRVVGNAVGSAVHNESALGNSGGYQNYRFSGLAGYANNTAQTLELGPVGSTNGDGALGGDDVVTYSYPANAATKTKTVTYPVGEVQTALNSGTKTSLAGPTVYLPESGVTIKKAWFRVKASMHANLINTLALTAKVGSNTELSATTYNIREENYSVAEDEYLNYLIPSSEYTELQAATATSGKAVQMTSQWTTTTYGGAVSAELMMTYSYTGDTAGYQTSERILAGTQTSAAATTYSTSTGALAPTIPETGGTIAQRGASMWATIRATGTATSKTIGALLSTSTCSASATSTLDTYGSNKEQPNTEGLYKNVTSVMSTTPSQTYTACYVSGDTGIFSGELTITYQYTPAASLTQSQFRWYANANSTTPGSALASENTQYNLPNTSTKIRLRMNVGASGNTLAASSQAFKLQFATSTGGSWTDVGSGAWVFYNNATPADGAAASSAVLSGSTTTESYTEANPTASNPNAIAAGAYGEWDYSLDPASASTSSTYYFRMVKSDGSALNTYTTYPAVAFNNAPNVPTALAQTTTTDVGIPATTLANWDSSDQGWTTWYANQTQAQQTTTKRTGAGSMKITTTNQNAFMNDNNWTTRDLSANGSTFSAWIYLPPGTTGTNWHAKVLLYDANGDEVAGPYLNVTIGEWTYLSFTPSYSLLPNMQAVGVYVEPSDWNATGTNYIYFDDVQQGTGIWNNSTSVKFTGTVSDQDSADTDQLCIEAKPINTAFTNSEDSCGTGVSYSGTPLSANNTLSSLTNGTQYHWQARTKDAGGLYSSWVQYGGNRDTTTASPDFGIDTSAPTTATVYDGTNAGVDSSFNTNSLNILSANWGAFSDSISGLARYEYSIGTTAGGTTIATWTPVSATTTAITRTGLTLHTSQIYYFNVRAVDVAGNTSSIVSSDGQLVSPTLSFGISSTTIDFGSLNAGNSYTSTRTLDLTTSTNAYSGYVIYQYVDSQPWGTSGTMPAFSGNWTSPASWTGTGFGYTSSDTSIQATGNKFGSGTLFAAAATTGPGDIVADHTAAVAGTSVASEMFTLTYRITSSSSQAAGVYHTAVHLGIVATF